MTTGSKTYNGLGVPLYGESEIIGQTAATDILTITGASSQSGDYLVIRDTNAGELLVVERYGHLNLKKASSHAAATPFAALNLAMLHTLPTSAAGLSTGDMFLFHVTTDIWRLAVVQSGAASLFHRARRASLDVTLGSAS
jgi:hypothetical protein